METMTKVEHVLDVLVDNVPFMLAAEGIETGSCVGATRIACLALAEVGIKASPLSVRLTGFSERYVRAMEEGEIDPSDPDASSSEVHARLHSEGAWVVDVDVPPVGMTVRPRPNGRRGWSGHLVALVDRRYVVDLTIHQMNRPSKGMKFEPFHFRVPPRFMGGDPAVFTFGTSVARYVRTNDNTYLVAPDWTNVRRDHWLVRDVARMLRRRSS